MQHHDYPDITKTGRQWSVMGSRAGTLTTEYFHPDKSDGIRSRSWLWVDELLLTPDGGEPPPILTDAHGPHEYSGYELHVRKQPVLTAFSHHDHLIIPDLDLDQEGDQTVSIVIRTHFIWTRRNQRIAGFDRFLASHELKENAPTHETAVYAFVGILRVLLESLDHNLIRREQQTYSLEDRFLRRERNLTFDSEDGEDELRADFAGQPGARVLTELRIKLAWLRKQYDAFDRVVNDLYDPAHGAFRKGDKPELEEEAVPYFQHLRDQIQRALNKIEHLHDIQSTLDQLLAAEQAESTNRTLLRLTWLSMFFLPVSVIAGVFGMNVSLLQTPRVFDTDSAIATALFAVAILAALWFFIAQNRRQNRLVGRETIPKPDTVSTR